MTLQDGKYRIVEAFKTADGMMYYQYDNALHIPADRMFAALTLYEEFNMRCTREYLELHCRAVDKVLAQKSLGLNDLILVQTLHNNLKERLNLPPHPELIYKYASVIFMDGSESPYMYDHAYNEEKIKKWKTEPKLLDFFLTLDTLNLMPHINLPYKHFQTYLEIADAIQSKHLNDQQQALSKGN